MDLSGGSSEETKSMNMEVEEEVFTYELIRRCEINGVELSEEAIEPGSTARKRRNGIVGIGRKREPRRTINDEFLVIATETDEKETIFGEFSETVIGRFNIVESEARDKVFVEMSSTIHRSAWRRTTNLTLENPGGDVTACEHYFAQRAR